MGEAMIETTTAQVNTCPNELKNRTQITGYAVKNKDSHVSQGIRRIPSSSPKCYYWSIMYIVLARKLWYRDSSQNRTKQNRKTSGVLLRMRNEPRIPDIPQLQRRSLQMGKPQNRKPSTVGACGLVFSQIISRC